MGNKITHTFIVAILFSMMAYVPAEAQVPTTDASLPRISLVTILPGKSLYSAFGHTAVRVVNQSTNKDILYNYGLSARPFDARFAYNIMLGRMEFMVAALDTSMAFRFYSEVERRTIVEQELKLSGDQIAVVISTLEYDSKPENRIYNYRFFTDNCATRVWNLLDPLMAIPESRGGEYRAYSLRSEIDNALADNPWLRLGLGILQGPKTDSPLSGKSPLFLPDQLMRATAIATNRNNSQLRFSHDAAVINDRGDQEKRAFWLSPKLTVILILLLALLIQHKILRKYAVIFDSILMFGAFSVCLGIFSLWILAGYQEAGFNLNLAWANPLPLLALCANRVGRNHQAAFFLALVAAVFAGGIAIGGGFGVQQVSTEVRLLAASLALRCMGLIRFPLTSRLCIVKSN